MENEKKYFRVFRKMGVSGIRLAIHMNRAFKAGHMPYKARWTVRKAKLLSSIEEMIDNDIPVLFSIGPGFFKKADINFFVFNAGSVEKFEPRTRCRDHYVTITGIVEHNGRIFLEISSWGSKYYVDYKEYREYVDNNDNYLFSNILYIKHREEKNHDVQRISGKGKKGLSKG